MRYLFSVLASEGYVYPAMAVASEIQSRGHEVAFATGPAFAARLEQSGYSYIPTDEQDHIFSVPQWMNQQSIRRQANYVTTAVCAFEPDVIVASALAMGPLVIARKHHIPVAVLGLATYPWPTINGVAVSKSERWEAKRYDDFWKIYRLAHVYLTGKPPPLEQSTHSQSGLLGDLFLLRSVPELQQNIETLPEKVHLVGGCLWESPISPDKPLLDWINNVTTSQKPIIYVQHNNRWSNPFSQNGVTMNGIPDFWPVFLEALGQLPVAVAMSTNDLEIIQSNLPDNFFVGQHIPHQAILPYADGVITNGTTSIMLNALSYGLPMVIIAAASESYDVAKVCQQAEIAHCIPANEVTPANLKEGIRAMLYEGNLRQNAQCVQQALARYKGAAQAATLLETLAMKRSPVLRQMEPLLSP
ncbi:MAG: glycosyltransferase [Chloroflexi bacterium]|nr:glycosyltransferase [Chloroflexota bacterium]